VEGKGVGQWMLRLTPVYLRPQKKSPHGLHHLLGYARLPSPQTSWAYPAWPRTPDSDKTRVPCVAACAARRWRATRCASPARATRRRRCSTSSGSCPGAHSAALRTPKWCTAELGLLPDRHGV
jgi:hypothetical protein